MASEGSAFAPLLANLEQRLQIDGEKRYFTFPPFALGMQPYELIFDVNAIETGSPEDLAKAQREVLLNQEDFSILVNQIPSVGATHLTDGRMLWDVYERVINTADLPLDELSDEQKVLDITEEFSKYRTDFSLSEKHSVKADGSEYYATSASPSGENITWTKLPLDKSRFNELSAQISQSVRDWLSESNLLDEPLGAGISIESLSAEVFPVEVRRPWLNLRLFQSRSWKWDDQPLSDGGSPPQGILPAYVVGVVFARNLVIDLDTESASGDAGSLARTLTVANKEIIRRLRAFRPDVVSARPFMVANRQVARRQPISRTPIPARLLISRAVTTGPAQDTGNGAITTIDGPEGSVHSFPVPPGFRCDPIIAQASSHLQKAESELRELNQQRLTLQQQVNQLEQQVQETLGRLKGLERYGNAETVTIRDHRDGRNTTIVINVKERRDRWNQDLGQSQRELAAKSASRDAETNKIKAQSEVVAQLSEALEEWKNLSQSKPEEGRMFILGFICERLPKSPDPDPQLFAA